MRKYIFTLIGISFCLLTYAQNDVQAEMTKAGKLYDESRFVEAVAVYDSILNTGMESSTLYFNMGNAWYKAGDPTSAILNYERALLLEPDDEDIIYNLELARTHVVDNIEELPEMLMDKWRRGIIEMHSADGWGIHSVITFISCLLLFALFLFSSRIQVKKLAFFFSVLSVLYSLFAYSFASAQKKKITDRNTAIITTRSVTVKGSPSETGTELFIIHEGLKVELTDSLGDWIEIKIADGNEGWVKDTVVVRI
jgi:tetratricopeptide (TPR) repeat protein